MNEVIALLDAAGVTNPILREAAIIDYAATCDPTYIDSVALVEDPVEEVEVLDPLTIWDNGGRIEIGSAGAPARFNVGAIGASVGADVWSDTATTDNWSDPANWNDGTIPTPMDGVVFDVDGDGGRNVVDTGLSIATLEYTGAGSHVADLDSVSVLQISDGVDILTVPTARRNTLIVQNDTEVVTHSDAVRIGVNDIDGGSVSGNMVLRSGASMDASNVGALSIGVTDNAGSSSIQGGASADGSLTLGSNSVLQLGSGGAQSSLNIGFNSSPVAGTATGFFDASNDAASVAIDVAELNVGRGIDENRIGVGELIVGSEVSLSADTANIGTGDGSSGTIRFGDQTLSIGDAGNLNIQILNFDGGLLTGDTIELDDTSGIFGFSGGTLAVDQFLGNLVQSGGVFDAGSQSGVPAADGDFIGTTLVQGDYSANSVGVVRVDIDGLGAGIGHDQISILGVLDLNADSGAGAELEIDLQFVASLGDAFLFITNDGVDPIAGEFASLGQGDQFDEVFGGDTFTFEIENMAGDGNDIELEVISIA